MHKNYFPLTTIFIICLTFFYSTYVSYSLTGSFMGKISVLDLEKFGGVTPSKLYDFEIWRLLLSQFIHVKPIHMIYNVLSFFILGVLLEKHIGSRFLFVLWFASGALGTLYSTNFVSYPWNIGTGSSQAVLGVSSFALLLALVKEKTTNMLKFAVVFSILPAMILDVIYAHYPKPGHVLSIFVGLVLSLVYYRKHKLYFDNEII
ncbi:MULTISPECIES: rhomboid family intramembrane serine protease [unclassified Brenneria]|uniref:rhomboid family intramembrane serine protease n=1 Tax=unclassified Brenneria TaxID=2634434 RepID=UPI0029C5C10F|nr:MULTISPECIES: rhomboid family intramembrane serine protease [unclassified Brenneria]MDX5629078.1 rhomboid family intramembrane serine protease [Brenneria sp. L3-3Z]MDX5696217.1 rhomboid family intramembrane serine protease [Brenneria sp. L4-2C]